MEDRTDGRMRNGYALSVMTRNAPGILHASQVCVSRGLEHLTITGRLLMKLTKGLYAAAMLAIAIPQAAHASGWVIQESKNARDIVSVRDSGFTPRAARAMGTYFPEDNLCEAEITFLRDCPISRIIRLGDT
jgi:hypothetical protein